MRPLSQYLPGTIMGFIFIPFIDEDVVKVMAVVIPIVVQVISNLFKVREKIVKEVVERVKKDVAQELEEFELHLKKEVVDEVWDRIDTITKLRERDASSENA